MMKKKDIYISVGQFIGHSMRYPVFNKENNCSTGIPG